MPLAALTWGNPLFSWYQLLLLLFTRMQNHKQAAQWGFRWVHADPGAGPAGPAGPSSGSSLLRCPESRSDSAYAAGQKGALFTIIPCNITFFNEFTA